MADLSFIALRHVLPVLRGLASPAAAAVVLVKPQFEAARGEVGKGGVVREPSVWARVLREVAEAATPLGWTAFDATASPLLGPAGNVEFLAHLAPGVGGADIDDVVADAVQEGQARRRGAG